MAKNLEKMFGGQDKEKKWKQDNAPHISKYNQKYYAKNQKSIQAHRKQVRKVNRMKKQNSILPY